MDTAVMTPATPTVRRYELPPTRYNRRCRCGAKHSRLIVARVFTWNTPESAVETLESGAGEHLPKARSGANAIALECACGRRILLAPVLGKRNNGIRCDARCQGATGHNCECSCGGENHGAAHSA